jgi:tetratricopeptide (TPR) repeat protein
MPDDGERLIQQAHQARRENRPQDAQRDLAEAVAICRRSGSQLELARALCGLGQIERDLNRRDAALGHYQEAVVIYRGERNFLRLAHAIRHVGDILRHHRRYELAGPCYQEALTIYRGHEETSQLDLANALRGFALLKEETGDAAGARSAWQEAKELYAAVKVEAGVAESARRVESLASAH